MIHPSAIIEPGAQLAADVSVGPFCVVGPHVRMGSGCQLRNQVTITGHTTIGANCHFFSGAVIGEIPQDLKYRGERTETIIGDDNHFREHVTVHSGTEVGNRVTRIGDHNRFLVGVHIAHDVEIGSNVIISNNVQIAGHVHIEDCVTIAGQCGIHQFVTIGRYAMLGGLSGATCDVPPFFISKGYPAVPRSLNKIGLRRWGVSADDVELLGEVYRQLYSKSNNGTVPFIDRLQQIEHSLSDHIHVRYLCAFLRRTLAVGNSGRHLESLRQDRPGDHKQFYQANSGMQPNSSTSAGSRENK